MSDHSPEKSEKAWKKDVDSAPTLSTQPIPDNAKYIQVENVDYALALQTGPQLKATSARSLQLFSILLVAFMGSLSNGFDGSGGYY